MYFKHIETDCDAARLKNEALKKDAAARLAKNAAWNKQNKAK